MNAGNERLARVGLAAIAAAVTALVIVSDYHPCDGIGRLGVFPFVAGGIALLASAPTIRARNVLLPGMVAAVVLAIAMGIDYSSSGPPTQTTTVELCEPVEGVAGFMLAFLLSGTFAMVGVLIAASLVAVVHEALSWRARSAADAS